MNRHRSADSGEGRLTDVLGKVVVTITNVTEGFTGSISEVTGGVSGMVEELGVVEGLTRNAYIGIQTGILEGTNHDPRH